MANTFNALFNRVAFTAGAVVAATSIAAPAALADEVLVDGSSTVYPITEAVAEDFIAGGGANVVVNVSGTGGGFKVFCVGETDISNASRPIKDEEREVCAANGVEFIEIPVAFDALTVVVSEENNLITDLSLEQLARLWSSEYEGEATTWADLDPSWPAEAITLYGPGADSGTFDYFVEEGIQAVVEDGESRGDYTASEDDNVLVIGVGSDVNALGYFGLAYYLENQDSLNAVAINGVYPSTETVNNGTYTPFARPIFIYVNTESYANDPDVAAFVDFYIGQLNSIPSEIGYVNLPDEMVAESQALVDGM